MTTVELAQLITRNTTVKDLSGCEPGESLSIIAGINAGIQRFYKIAPTRWNRTGASQIINVPATVSCAVTAASTTVSNAPFSAAMRGCSVIIGDDPQYNEIISTNQLLNPYLGTTGTQTGTVYYDAVAITDFAVERIVSDPVVRETGLRLVRAEQYESVSYRMTPWADRTGNAAQRTVGGYPEFYRVNYVGMSDSSTPDAVVLLRLDPIPTIQCVLNFDVDVRPASYRISALETPSTIPIDDTLAYRTIVPLCEAEMTRAPIWNAAPDLTNRVLNAGMRAEEDIRDLNDEFAKSRRRVITRKGW